MNLRQAALVGLAGLLSSAAANATVFYIDQFDIQRDQIDNPGVLAPWFVDNFDDGIPPPSSNGTFPNGTTGRYITRPDPMPGPEQDGKLRLDSSEGYATLGQAGVPILLQRARLRTNISNDDEDLNRGLKETQVFTVTGTFDLIQPTMNAEGYGIRLVDFGQEDANDNLQLRLLRRSSGQLAIEFAKANFDLGGFDIIDRVPLSDITGIADYDQIALTLTKSSNADKLISAAFELIDFDGVDLLVPLEGTAEIFDGERWTRPAFFTFVAQDVSAPATLMLLSLGLAGVGYRRRKQIKAAKAA